MTRTQLRRHACAELKTHGLSLRAYARYLGLSTPAHLWTFLVGGAKPTPAVVKALGYRRVDAESYEARK